MYDAAVSFTVTASAGFTQAGASMLSIAVGGLGSPTVKLALASNSPGTSTGAGGSLGGTTPSNGAETAGAEAAALAGIDTDCISGSDSDASATGVMASAGIMTMSSLLLDWVPFWVVNSCTV
jgi:hypothetical protein